MALNRLTPGLIALALCPAFAQDVEVEPPPPAPSKASLAVMPFNYHRNSLQVKDGWAEVVRKEFQTTELTDKLITALVATRKFDVVERKRLDDALKEIKLTEQELADPKRAVEAGKLIGADYLLTGSISLFSVRAEWTRVPNSRHWSRALKSHVIVDMRIVDSRTSRVVAAHKGEVQDVTRALYDSNDAPPAVAADFGDRLQRKLCDELVIDTIDSVYPIRIVDSDGIEVLLNRGTGGGLEPGMTLDVLVETKQITDPDTGEVLGFRTEQIGQIRVTEVEERLTHGTIVSGEAPFPEGAICKRAAPPTEEPETPRGPKW
ncbi:MAG: CsgG/HfaB family protein [Planctomycetota bacterium]